MLPAVVSPDMGESGSRTSETAECEECGTTSARATRVRFVDYAEATVHLCETCVDEFRTAVLVEEVHPVS